MENLQANLISEHVNKVNNLLLNERSSMRHIQQLSNEILQEDYLLMKANAHMTTSMEAKFQQLYKAYDGHRGVTFSEENIVHHNYDVDDNNDMVLRPEVISDNDDDEDMDCDDNNEPIAIPTGPKARRALHPEMTNGHVPSLDVTQVIQRHDDDMDDCQPINSANATFLLKPTRPAIINKKSTVSRVLKDTHPNINKDIVAKSKHFAVVSIHVQILMSNFCLTICSIREAIPSPCHINCHKREGKQTNSSHSCPQESSSIRFQPIECTEEK